MPMPNNLILVRHGRSEGNVVVDAAKKGDESGYTDEFRDTPGRRWHLTPEGRQQAIKAGEWILKNIGENFDKYYTSSYTRARETAALLNLPNAKWMIDRRLRERDWGDIDSLPRSEFHETFPLSAQTKHINSLYWRPPGGESIADTGMRFRDFLDTLIRECADKDVIAVNHGEFMWAARAHLEYMTDDEWMAADKDPSQKIHNGHIFHYSRINPDTKEQADHINWVKRICPAEGLETDWIPIVRHIYTNEELLAGCQE